MILLNVFFLISVLRSESWQQQHPDFRGYIRDRDQDRVPGFGIGYIIRDFGTAGYIRDGLFANEPSPIYPAVPISRIYQIPNTQSRITALIPIRNIPIPNTRRANLRRARRSLRLCLAARLRRKLRRLSLALPPVFIYLATSKTMTSHTRLYPAGKKVGGPQAPPPPPRQRESQR